MIKLEKIRVVKVIDEDPDLSYLGKYSDTPQNGAIDREERGDMGRGEFRYFNPANFDDCAEKDYQRYKDHDRGNWGMIGIKTEADILIQTNQMKINKSWITQEFGSGGLWGIESDSGPEYLKEIALEELKELKDILMEIGIPENEIEEMSKKAIEEFMR